MSTMIIIIISTLQLAKCIIIVIIIIYYYQYYYLLLSSRLSSSQSVRTFCRCRQPGVDTGPGSRQTDSVSLRQTSDSSPAKRKWGCHTRQSTRGLAGPRRIPRAPTIWWRTGPGSRRYSRCILTQIWRDNLSVWSKQQRTFNIHINLIEMIEMLKMTM